MDTYRVEVCVNVAGKRTYFEVEGLCEQIPADGLDAWLDGNVLERLREHFRVRVEMFRDDTR